MTRKVASVGNMHQAQVAITEILGQVIRRHRQHAGITQEEVARQLALSPSALSRIESGVTPLTVVQLRHLGEVLGTPGSRMLAEAERLAELLVGVAPGLTVVEQRPRRSSDAGAAWFIGGAAVGVLIAAMLAKGMDDDD